MAKDMEWFDMGPIPIYFGVCFSEAAFEREMKRLHLKDSPEFLSKDAACHYLTNPEQQDAVIIAFDPAKVRGKSQAQIAAILAHEASHCADFAIESMGDAEPSGEMRAYLVQHFTQSALAALKRRKSNG